MTHIISLDSRRKKKPAPDPDALVAGALSDYLTALLDAVKHGDEGLASIHLDTLRPTTKMLVQRFAEHLDEMQTLAEHMTITRNMARFRARIGGGGAA